MRQIELMTEEPEGNDDMPEEESVKHRLRLTPDPDNPNSGQGTFTVDEGPRKLGKMHPPTGKHGRRGGATGTIGQAAPRTPGGKQRPHWYWRKPGE